MEIQLLNTPKFKMAVAAIEKKFSIKCKKQLCLIFFLLIVISIKAQTQSIISKSMFAGDTWLHGCMAQSIQMNVRPLHGTLDLSNELGNTFAIRYRPNAHFVGIDSFILYVQNIDNQGLIINETQIFKVAVTAPLLQLKDDFGQIIANQTITLNPLANDISANGGLQLRALPLVNHGTANIVNNQIQFTPKLGFQGVTHIHYLACSQIDTCATAQITLYVTPETLPHQDTLCVYAYKNQAVTFVAPLDFELNHAFTPQQGVVFPHNEAFTYIPATNYVGKDSFELHLPTANSHFFVQVSVVDRDAPPQYLRPDFAFTSKNNIITTNVLLNDSQDVTLANLGQVTNGRASILPNGNIEFVPNSDFEGIATVEYFGAQQGITYNERGLLTIIVHNYMPSRSEFKLTAVAGLPLKMRYPVPITDFYFDIVNSPQFGVIEYQLNTKMLIYTSQQNATHDACDVRYRVGNESKLVRLIFNILPSNVCLDECMQTGDANGDGVVDMLDLSTLAQHLGTTKHSATPQNANWQLFGDNGKDLKLADLNRDGIISAADTNVLSANFGQTYQLRPALPILPAYAQLNLTTNTNAIYNGDVVELKISLGSENQPIKNIKGFNFSFEFDPNQINRDALSIDFKPNKWLKFSSPTLEMVKRTQANRVEAAIIQASGRTVKGHGEVGVVRVVIVEDLCCFFQRSKSVVRFAIKEARLIDSAGNSWVLPDQVIEIPIKEMGKMERTAPLTNTDLWAFPNPTNGSLQLHLNGDNALNIIKIYDMLGKQVATFDMDNIKYATIDISHLPKGFYVLEANTLEGRLVKKINKL